MWEVLWEWVRSVREGLVEGASIVLARPGRRLTGLSTGYGARQFGAKGLLRELNPGPLAP